MIKLAIIIGGCLFIAAGIVELINGNWQGALFLIAIGAGLVIFFLRGSSE